MRQRLAETSGDDAYPLDVHGRRVIDCHEQLVGILRNRLGQNHADFFAQPAPTAGSRSIVWYTPLSGEVARVDTLAPDERQRLTQRAERILGDVEGLAAQTVSDGPAGGTVAELLRAAAQVAPGAALFSVGGKVVTILWGHRCANSARAHTAPADPRSARSPETSTHETRQAPASDTIVHTRSTVGTPAQPRRWLVPSLVALLVVAIVAWAWHGDFLVRVAGRDDLSAQIAAVEARNQTLTGQISELKKNPSVAKCVPEPVPSPGKQKPAKQSFHSPAGITWASRESDGATTGHVHL